MFSPVWGRKGFVLSFRSFPPPFDLQFPLVCCLFGCCGWGDWSMRGVRFVCILGGFSAPLSLFSSALVLFLMLHLLGLFLFVRIGSFFLGCLWRGGLLLYFGLVVV